MTSGVSSGLPSSITSGILTGMDETRTEKIVARVLADPYTKAMNTDGGAAAADFIRNAKARNARSQAEKDASLRANVERCLAQMAALR
jgi:hypothetical protein